MDLGWPYQNWGGNCILHVEHIPGSISKILKLVGSDSCIMENTTEITVFHMSGKFPLNIVDWPHQNQGKNTLFYMSNTYIEAF